MRAEKPRRLKLLPMRAAFRRAHRDARHVAQRVGEARRALRLHQRAVDDGDRLRNVADRRGHAAADGRGTRQHSSSLRTPLFTLTSGRVVSPWACASAKRYSACRQACARAAARKDGVDAKPCAGAASGPRGLPPRTAAKGGLASWAWIVGTLGMVRACLAGRGSAILALSDCSRWRSGHGLLRSLSQSAPRRGERRHFSSVKAMGTTTQAATACSPCRAGTNRQRLTVSMPLVEARRSRCCPRSRPRPPRRRR